MDEKARQRMCLHHLTIEKDIWENPKSELTLLMNFLRSSFNIYVCVMYACMCVYCSEFMFMSDINTSFAN